MTKIVDTREPWEIREQLLLVGWEQKALASGDYFFLTRGFKKVGVTRKAISDLLASISFSGGKRPFGVQLEEMADYYDIKILLIEGSWQTVTPKKQLVSSRGIEYYTWDMVWNYLRSWQDRGFSLELTTNEGHTVQRLQSLYTYYQKEYHSGGATRGLDDDRVLAFPAGCRGKSAIEVLKCFGSLAKVSQAKIVELQEVHGIGNKKAEQIRLHFNRDGR